MSEIASISATTSGVVQDAQPTLVRERASHAPVFITQQEVGFSTAAATSPRPASVSGRLIDAIRVVTAAVQLPPARRHYPQPSRYLEQSRMARELERL